MAGAYRAVLSGATVQVREPGSDDVVHTYEQVTVSVRDGVGRIRTGATTVDMDVPPDGLQVMGRKQFKVTGVDGTTWTVDKPCGCGG